MFNDLDWILYQVKYVLNKIKHNAFHNCYQTFTETLHNQKVFKSRIFPIIVVGVESHKNWIE